MPDQLDFHDVIKNHKDLAEEIELLLSILPVHDDITKESLITAGIYAKLDMILDELHTISKRITVIENKLNVDNRVLTWLKTTKIK